MPHHQFLPFVDSDLNLDLTTAAILDAAYDRALADFTIAAQTAFGKPSRDA